MKTILIVACGFAIGSIYALQQVRGPNLVALSNSEASLAVGGWSFQDCLHVGLCDYKTCTYVAKYGWYEKSDPNNAKECDYWAWTSCSNSLTTTCFYRVYLNVNCTLCVPESDYSRQEDVCML